MLRRATLVAALLAVTLSALSVDALRLRRERPPAVDPSSPAVASSYVPGIPQAPSNPSMSGKAGPPPLSQAQLDKGRPALEKAYRAGDKDGDGKLSLDEFIAIVQRSPQDFMMDDSNHARPPMGGATGFSAAYGGQPVGLDALPFQHAMPSHSPHIPKPGQEGGLEVTDEMLMDQDSDDMADMSGMHNMQHDQDSDMPTLYSSHLHKQAESMYHGMKSKKGDESHENDDLAEMDDAVNEFKESKPLPPSADSALMDAADQKAGKADSAESSALLDPNGDAARKAKPTNSKPSASAKSSEPSEVSEEDDMAQADAESDAELDEESGDDEAAGSDDSPLDSSVTSFLQFDNGPTGQVGNPIQMRQRKRQARISSRGKASKGCYRVCPQPVIFRAGEAFGGPFGPDPYYSYGHNSMY